MRKVTQCNLVSTISLKGHGENYGLEYGSQSVIADSGNIWFTCSNYPNFGLTPHI